MSVKNNANEVLFIGAHPDDIEIGAWSAVYKLVARDWKIFFIVMTSESDTSERMNEAIKSAKSLSENIEVYFLKEHDGLISCNKETVSKLRTLVATKSINAKIIFCHSKADSHNDHRAVNEIVISAFRESIIIEYPVINSLIKSDFKPNIFSSVTPVVTESQSLALACHQSQINRISTKKIAEHQIELCHSGREIHVDKFKATLQAGYDKKLLTALMNAIDDIPINKLLGPIIREGLVVINGKPVFRKIRSIDDSIVPCGKSVSGLLRTYMNTIVGMKEIIELQSSDFNVHEFSEENSILINGGAVSNSFAREYYDHFIGLNYKIDYEIPNYQNQCVVDLSLKIPKKIYPKYKLDDFGKKNILEDIGILTFMKNPLNTSKWLIGCMGVHSIGTVGCFRALLDNNMAFTMLEKIDDAFSSGKSGIQVLIGYRAGGEPKFLAKSWRKI